ncbi:MAG: helix-turn-helix transcriptional regulator [Rubrobacter sp.]|jgi:transcriptional regulator with XRE-family HTH domain|nr:helix-turn-helix transcriptional regulator [Rubrobacter sp.]
MLSQQELADRAGVSLFTVQRIERGEGSVRPKTGRAIAGALGVGVEDLLGKAQAPLWPEERPERRADVYEPWAEFVNRFAERWEQKIAGGVLDHGSMMEFADVLGDLGPVLGRLALEEKQEQPAEYPYTFGPVAGGAMNRLLALLNPLIAAGAKQVEDSDLARLRHRREQMVIEQDCAESG